MMQGATRLGRPRQPLTVIGGFLGAGKTTLVNRLLAGGAGRYAVLVNDFGAVNVDSDLIASHDGETLRLTNGCICCSLGDGFLGTLARVLAEPVPFDHIIIEASGVGDPEAIAEIAIIEPDLRLSAIVVVVDAEAFPAQIADTRLGDTLARQVRAADILLLNKCDLAGDEAKARARALLAELAPGHPVVETVGGRMPADIVAPGLIGEERPRFRATSAADHEVAFDRFIYRRPGAFEAGALRGVLERAPSSVLRLKGWVRLGATAETRVLQMVGRRWTLAPASSPARGIELVGIAASDAHAGEALADLLDHALVPAADGGPDFSSAMSRNPYGDDPRCN
ncbi:MULTISPECIES: GTP-binding protein [unclassified Xanthobacter]|uniref:CobW family GTP-binding protein n=1 Tax=unclassified Xanthobacter TaxID=2623496 RepID=UPI001F30A26D|nr:MULTISPECIES: GTP-binding protein [unclassified Xanthobacter]